MNSDGVMPVVQLAQMEGVVDVRTSCCIQQIDHVSPSPSLHRGRETVVAIPGGSMLHTSSSLRSIRPTSSASVTTQGCRLGRQASTASENGWYGTSCCIKSASLSTSLSPIFPVGARDSLM